MYNYQNAAAVFVIIYTVCIHVHVAMRKTNDPSASARLGVRRSIYVVHVFLAPPPPPSYLTGGGFFLFIFFYFARHALARHTLYYGAGVGRGHRRERAGAIVSRVARGHGRPSRPAVSEFVRSHGNAAAAVCDVPSCKKHSCVRPARVYGVTL